MVLDGYKPLAPEGLVEQLAEAPAQLCGWEMRPALQGPGPRGEGADPEVNLLRVSTLPSRRYPGLRL